MIQEIRLEFIKRIMNFLIRKSKGEKYVDRLENSYKNLLLVMFFLILSLFGTVSKYTLLYVYSNDADYLYRRLMNEEKHVARELERTIVFAREQFNVAQSLRKENFELTQAVNDLRKENEELKKNMNNKN